MIYDGLKFYKHTGPNDEFNHPNIPDVQKKNRITI